MLVCILDADRMLFGDDGAFAATLELLARVAEEWSRPTPSRPARPFHVLLHSEPPRTSGLRARVAAAGSAAGDIQAPLK